MGEERGWSLEGKRKEVEKAVFISGAEVEVSNAPPPPS
jgi:hypothetical protein